MGAVVYLREMQYATLQYSFQIDNNKKTYALKVAPLGWVVVRVTILNKETPILGRLL
jgi:hypothetical protein